MIDDGNLVRVYRLEVGPVTWKWQHMPSHPHHESQVSVGADLKGNMLPVDICNGIFESPGEFDEKRGLLAPLI